MKVTWAYHFTGSSPDWTVDPEWLQRVSDVIDMATSIGLYTIVNVHHGEPLQAEKASEDFPLLISFRLLDLGRYYRFRCQHYNDRGEILSSLVSNWYQVSMQV